MRTFVVSVILTLFLFVSVESVPAQTPPGDPPRALFVNDLGTGHEATLAAMQSRNWTVTSMGWEQLMATSEADLLAQWDVIWLPPASDYDKLRQLSSSGGCLGRFAHRGGIVVMPGIVATAMAIDTAPGGVDVKSSAAPGSITIDLPEHPLIAGAANGGSNLTVGDLDPNGTGGGGYLMQLPQGLDLVTIAHNNDGPILGEYEQAKGRVIISLLDMLSDNCLANLLIYVQSLVAAA